MANQEMHGHSGGFNPIELQKSLKGMDYPAKKDDLVRKARDNGADDEIIRMLERLPDREFDGPSGVSQEMGKLH